MKRSNTSQKDNCSRKKTSLSPTATPRPSRHGLQKELAKWRDNEMLSTPDRIGMQAATVQNHTHGLKTFYAKTGEVATPSTSTLLDACQELENLGDSSIVNREGMLVRLGTNYVGRLLFKKAPPTTILGNPGPTSTTMVADEKPMGTPTAIKVNRAPTHLFGGSKPSNSKSGQAGHTIYETANTECYCSKAHALVCVEGFGPNARVRNTEFTKNGFVAIYYECSHTANPTKDCEFRARIYYPKYSSSAVPTEEANALSPKGTVAVEVAAPHSCGICLDWRAHLLGEKRGKIGLHPLLKQYVREMLDGMTRFQLPKPDEMFGLLTKKYGDETKELFPSDCVPIVRQQIREYWSKTRSRLLDVEHEDMVKYIEDIPKFRDKHALRFPDPIVPVSMSSLSTREGIRQYSRDVLEAGPTLTLPDPTLETKTRLYDHEMFVLPMPPDSCGDERIDSCLKHARQLDSVDNHQSEKHFICFTTMNLLTQVFVVAKKFNWHIMAATDSSHNSDSGGGKLFSFGFVTMAQVHNTRHTYRRTYSPVIFARILEEDQQVTLFALCCLAYSAKVLFGVSLDVKNGLISDHSSAFTNAFKRFFEGRALGQCFPHLVRKMKDQSGQRKDGAPGYLCLVKVRSYLKVTYEDVLHIGRSPTRLFQKTYCELSLRAWIDAGETRLAEVFKKSYVDNNDFCHYRFNQFGIPGDLPQGNSVERLHLSAKGSRDFTGYMQFGRSVDASLHNEFPKLCYNVSFRQENMRRCYKIKDKISCDGDSQLKHDISQLSVSDWLSYGPREMDEWYSNTTPFFGYEISEERIKQYHQAMNGIFPSADPEKRIQFWEAGTSICFVKRGHVPGETDMVWTCTCFMFWEHTVCPHTYYRQYGASPNVSVRPGKNQRMKDINRRYKHSCGFVDPEKVSKQTEEVVEGTDLC
jgi:hypothetical protein